MSTTTPQSPFTALQELQEEQREGWMTENKTATAMNIETLAGICFNTSRGLAPFECVEWKDVNDQLRAANIAGMQSALDAYLTSIGEGMPSVEDCRSVAKDGCEAIRNLLLSAFAKKMEAISRLPEKWRIDSGLTGYCSGMQAVKDLEAALGSVPVEPVPEVPADPYAHLKLAWANKRRIRTRRKGSDGWSEWNQPGDVVFYWNLPPECYEIEPLPADKWAAEKAAHAQGKRIEVRPIGHADDQWAVCNHQPMWVEHCEYRIAPDPAPAGKLTDVQLGEIGAKAAKQHVNSNLMAVGETCWQWENHKSARTAFAAAVREAVEKEQTEEIARLTAIIEQAIEMVNTPGTTKGNLPQAINAKIMQCDEFHDATLKKLDAAKTEIERLKGEYSSLLQAYKKLEATEQKTRDAYDRAMTDCVTLRAEHNALTAEFAKANAELERLRWHSVEVKPTREDADPEGYVLVCGVDSKCRGIHDIRHPFGSHDSHWMPFPSPPPAPTAEEVERADFEKACAQFDVSFTRDEGGNYRDSRTLVLFDVWQLARAKEAQS